MQRRSLHVSREVIETAASESNTDLLELPLLYNSLDPDALDRLIQSMSDGQVSFTYAGQYITVNSRGDVALGNDRYPGE